MPYKEFDINGIGKIKIYKRRGNRSLRLTVAADGKVKVTIPLWAPYQAGAAFAMSRRSWILAQSAPSAGLLTHGMPVGKTQRLLFVRNGVLNGTKTNVRAAAVVVTHGANQHPEDSDVQAAAQAACWRALKKQSEQLLAKRLNELAATYGFTYRSISIKRMKTRWGSCDQNKNIVFNLFLVQLPWEFIDYVILHELTHTRALHHGPDFWRQFEAVLPGARALRKQMRAYQPALLVNSR